MSALTDARLHEWRALCVGPDGADLRAVILTERRAVVAVLDELARMRAVVEAAREAGRRDGLEQAAQVCETDRLRWVKSGPNCSGALAAAHCRKAIRALIPADPAPMEAAADLPGHEVSPHVTPSQAIGGAAYALEMCAAAMDAETAFPEALAKAAVIAYLSLTGRDAEAEKVSHVGI